MNSLQTLSWFDRLKQQMLSVELQDREQLLILLRDAQQRDLLTADTLEMIEGAIQVTEMTVRDVMIPRAQMVVLEMYSPLEALTQVIVGSGHSRFPVIGENRDDVQGIFLAKDLLTYYTRAQGGHFDMYDLMRPAVFVPESKRLSVLLKEFRSSRNHMAIVVDEYGGTAGLVTIEDVIEQIIGDIDDEHDFNDEIFISPRGDNVWLIKALIPIEDFNEAFRTDFSNEEFDTIGGLLMQAFSHLPRRGERITLGGLDFEIARADNRRIHLVRVHLQKNAISPPEDTT